MPVLFFVVLLLAACSPDEFPVPVADSFFAPVAAQPSEPYTEIHPYVFYPLKLYSPIGAAGSGRVVVRGRNAGLGAYIVIKHRLPDDTTLFTIYGHLADYTVRLNDDVRKGQVIGISGQSGRAKEPGLRFQVDRDDQKDPHTPYMLLDPKRTVDPEELFLRYGFPVESSGGLLR